MIEVAELMALVRGVFDPMAQRLGLRPLEEIQHTHTSFSIGYSNGELGVEIQVDMADFFLYALLFRASTEAMPQGYVDLAGRAQKVHLQEALKALAVDSNAEMKKLRKLGGDYKNSVEMAERLARLLETHWARLRDEREVIFDLRGGS